MAGAAGFEPAHAEIKTQCLTAWRRPNKNSFFRILPLQQDCSRVLRLTPSGPTFGRPNSLIRIIHDTHPSGALRASNFAPGKIVPTNLSNLRMLRSKPSALPLGDAPIKNAFSELRLGGISST
jgi:hypothetical protein